MNKTLRWRLAIQTSGLPSTTRLVLLNLTIYMNDEGGNCFPGTRKQAADTGLSEKAVIDHLKVAVQAGFLQKQSRGLRGARWKANGYIALLPESTESRLALPTDNLAQAAEPDSVQQGATADPDDTIALNVVQPNSPINSPKESAGYFWQGEVIKLNEADFLAWQVQAGIEDDALAAYLEDRDRWLRLRPAEERGRWFMSTVRDLKNKYRKSEA
jgi:hypothetical protein